MLLKQKQNPMNTTQLGTAALVERDGQLTSGAVDKAGEGQYGRLSAGFKAQRSRTFSDNNLSISMFSLVQSYTAGSILPEQRNLVITGFLVQTLLLDNQQPYLLAILSIHVI